MISTPGTIHRHLYCLVLLFFVFVEVVGAAFTPTNRAALKAAIGTCNDQRKCTGGCLGEKPHNGSCPILAASKDATGNLYGVIGEWNTGNVTDMHSMFAYAINFNGDISTWQTSAVTDMSYMFYGATYFNGDLST